MPLSELVPITSANFEPKKVDSMSNLPSSVPDAGFVELLWENGQIVMQGQSSRPKKNSIPSTFSTHLAKSLDKDGLEGVPTKIGRFVEAHSGVNDFNLSGIPGQNEPNAQGEDMVPWLNYPIEDYSLDFLSEFSEGSMRPLTPENNSLQSNKDCNGFRPTSRDTHNVAGLDPGRIRNVQFTQVPQPWSGSLSNPKSRNLDFSSANNKASGYNPVWGDSGNKPQRQEMGSSKLILPPSSSPGLINFSHFLRPAALVKTNFQNFDRLKSNAKASTTTSTNFLESTLVESSVGLKSISQGHLAFESGKMDMKSVPKHPEEFVPVNRLEAIDRNGSLRNRNVDTGKKKILPNSSHGQKLGVTVNPPNLRHEKCSEPVVTSSSVCSGNGAGVASNDPNHRVKRKIQEVEESGYQSEDLEDESTGIRKTSLTRGTTTKRSRAAEVHNLSERRRRDRINEKMRALQELIPNCNKVDKASMLDEAIEYLKSLQLQLQMMSMGSGLCMPAMMFPPGMQHIHSPHMAHFPHMGVGMGTGMGMGMGIGYGMGMVNMNRPPLIPVPQMHGPQLPFSIPGTSSVPGMSTPSSTPMFGIPRQNHPVSMMHRAPFIHPPVHSTVPSAPGAPGTANAPVHAEEAAPCASTYEQRACNFNKKFDYKMEADDLRNPLSTQEKTEFCGESLKVETTNHVSPSVKESSSSISGNENLTTSTRKERPFSQLGICQLRSA